MRIIEATKDHIPEIQSLWKRLMHTHQEIDPDFFHSMESKKPFSYQNYINKQREKIFILIINGKVEGFVSTVIQMDFEHSIYNEKMICIIEDIFIADEYQNNGYGKNLIEEVKKWAIFNDVNRIQLRVFSKNKRAYQFYIKNGFEDLFNLVKLDF